jgi:hypothetical protein
MLRKSLFVLLCCISTYSFGQNLYFNEKSGASSTYSISNINKITFQNGDVVIETKSSTDKYAINVTRGITFQQLVTSVDDIVDTTESISAYPNPCDDVLNISDLMSNGTYFIYGMDGSLVQSDKATSAISVGGLSNGVYFLTLAGKNDTQTIKFIKQ